MSVPALRFRGFSGDWEVKILGEETIWNSGGTPSKQINSYWDGDIPWISASSMRGIKYFESDLKITKEGLLNGSKLALKNSLLLLVRGSMLFNKIPVGIAIKDIAFNQDVKSIRAKESLTSYFLLYWFMASEHKMLNMVTGTGIGAGKLDTQDLLSLNLILPSLPEQTKIVNFLTAVDEKISLLTQKADFLSQYKKGVMQQIFSQELRFKDDDGQEFPEWEEKTLGDISLKKSSNIAANKIESNVGEYKIYGAAGILKSVDFFTQDDAYISIVKDGAGVGRVFLCEPQTSVLGTLDIIQPKENINISFLYAVIEQIDFVIYVTGSTIPHIYFKDYSKEIISIPSLPEQTKIANFLTAIDEKITINQTQLNAVKQYKQGLLQQMFV